MQTLTWYIRRLSTMSPREVVWRGKAALTNVADRCLLPWRQRPRPLSAIMAGPDDLQDTGGPSPTLTESDAGTWSPGAGDLARIWSEKLIAQADQLADHRFSFFDFEARHLGNPIDWNRDHKSGQAAPLRFAPWIDYRDTEVTGDCKFVWEPNRHHQLVVLGRAYRATGDRKYAAAVVEQLDSWLDQCPYGVGMNWRSPLELGVRLINWVWALDLIRDSGQVRRELRERLLRSVHLHLWEITRKYSRGSSANNHLIGEAAGVFMATSYFPNLKQAARWRDQSREILSEEILRQTWPDGGTREQAVGYQLFVLQFFLIAGFAARKTGQDFSPAYWSRLEQMFAFLGALGEGGENLPLFGDSDDGYVLDLGGARGDVRPWLAVGAVLFARPDFKAWAGSYSETAYWLLGAEGRRQWEAIPGASGTRTVGQADRGTGTELFTPGLASRAFPETGYYLLQWSAVNQPQKSISVVFDCGDLGQGSLAAHGHADALSFTLRVGGQDILVDPGTYDYFTYPEWRSHFRSTPAHNTVVIDGVNQSEMHGPFMWSTKAQARCLAWQPTPEGGTICGTHDGYRRLKDPVTHQRTVTLDGPTGALTIRDDLAARGRHTVAVCFQVAGGLSVERKTTNGFEIVAGSCSVLLEFDPGLTVEALCGSEKPMAGWVSQGYHRKAAAYILVGRGTSDGPVSLACRAQIRRNDTATYPQTTESQTYAT